MQLQNPFDQETRLLFLYHYWCALCKRTDQGLELNHIIGRSSNSPLNACPICRVCHSHINHTQKEQNKQIDYVLKWLYNQNYKLTEKDLEFLKKNYNGTTNRSLSAGNFNKKKT